MNNSENSEVLVVGDSCIDKFTYGKSERQCPDVPAPVFKPTRSVNSTGMAGNVFLNLESLGVECDLLTNRSKTTKHRYVDLKSNHTFLRVDTEDEIDRVPLEWRSGYDLSRYKAIVIADYDKGFLHEDDIKFFCDNHDTVFLDTKKLIGTWCKNVFVIKINSPEFESIKNKIDLGGWENKLVVTLGDRGCMFLKEEGFCYYDVEAVEVSDLSGAGDTFQAGLVSKYLEIKDTIFDQKQHHILVEESIKFANICATEIVQQRGVSSLLSNSTVVNNSLLGKKNKALEGSTGKSQYMNS